MAKMDESSRNRLTQEGVLSTASIALPNGVTVQMTAPSISMAQYSDKSMSIAVNVNVSRTGKDVKDQEIYKKLYKKWPVKGRARNPNAIIREAAEYRKLFYGEGAPSMSDLNVPEQSLNQAEEELKSVRFEKDHGEEKKTAEIAKIEPLVGANADDEENGNSLTRESVYRRVLASLFVATSVIAIISVVKRIR